MEDSGFSSDFATSFLTWDDDDPTTAGQVPSDAHNEQPVDSGGITAGQTQVNIQQQTNQQLQDQFERIPQYHLMMGNIPIGQQCTISSVQSYPTGQQLVNVMAPSFPGMISSVHAGGLAAGISPVQQNSSLNQDGSSSANQASIINNTQLHPLGIQSSANCPPHLSNSPFMPLMYNPFLQPSAIATGSQHLWTMVPVNQQPSLQQSNHNQQQGQESHHRKQQSQQNVQHHQSQLRQQPQRQLTNTTAGQTTTDSVQTLHSVSTPITAVATAVAAQSQSKAMPPFYLFDAPCELRANFLQSQRMHNLPISEDINAYHYGMSVNGFHPQLNSQNNAGARSAVIPRLIDGRANKGRKAGKERNEREQKRAQKITDLIETIRQRMEKGGWKVELKSKYHTLSTCADYLKHLSKVTKEKEELVEKAKSDLAMTERKIEEEKANVERSDPESVASSLTCGSKKNDKHESDHKRKSEMADRLEQKKVKVNDTASEASSNDGQGSMPGMKSILLDKMSSGMSDISDSNKGSSESGDGKNEKAVCNLGVSGSVSSTAAIAPENVNESGGHADVVVKVRKPSNTHCVSVTKNCEKSSMDSDFELDYEEVFLSSNVPQLIATPAGRIVTCNDFFVKVIGLSKDEVTKLTIFSLVQPDKLSNLFEMVAEALRGDRRKSRRDGLNERDVGQNQDFFSNGGDASDTSDGKGRVSESSSVNKRLGSDSSENNETPSSGNGGNQTSSSCSRRIGSESSRSTEHGSESLGNDRNGSESSGNTTHETSKSLIRWDIAAMTLPCISFPSQMKANNVSNPSPLYMTVALMTDDDPNKICFHCIITDDPGTNGTIGFVTPDLLALLVVPEQPRQDHAQTQNVSSSSKFATVSRSSYGEHDMAESFLFNNEDDSEEEEDDEDDNVDTAR